MANTPRLGEQPQVVQTVRTESFAWGGKDAVQTSSPVRIADPALQATAIGKNRRTTTRLVYVVRGKRTTRRFLRVGQASSLPSGPGRLEACPTREGLKKIAPRAGSKVCDATRL